MMSWLLHRPFVLIALGVLLILLPAAFFHFSLLPQNPEQYLTHPGKEVVDYFSRDPTGTVIELAYAGFSRDQLRKGVIPLWSPYQSLGHPFIADTVVSALFAPLNLLRLILPPSYWDVVFIVNLILGCWFVFLLARSYRLDRRSAVVAGLSLAALGSTQTFIQVSSIALVTSWIPLVLCGIELQLAPVRTRFSWVPLVAGLYGVITGGHPTITLLAVLFAAGYACVRLVQVRPAAVSVFRISALSLLAVSITAAQWLPFVAYLGYRGNTFADYSAFRYHIQDAPAFVLPYVYGQLNYTVAGTRPPVDLGDYWGLGWLAPVLLVFFVASFRAAARRHEALALLLTSAPVLLWAFGVPPFSLASKLPFLNRVRGHYATVTIAFVVAVLIGFGYQFLARRAGKLRGTMLATGAILALAAVTASLTLQSRGVALADAAMYVGTRSLPTLLWVAAGLAALFMLRARCPTPQYRERLFWVTLAGIALSAVGLFAWGSSQAIVVARWSTIASFFLVVGAAMLPRINSKLLPAMAAVAVIASGLAIQAAPNHLPRRHNLMAHGAYVDYLKQHQLPEYRSYGLDGFLFPNFSAANGIASVNVITGFLTSQIDQFFRSYLDLYQPPQGIMGLNRNPQPDSAPIEQFAAHKRFWDYIGVRYIVSSEGGFWEPVPEPGVLAGSEGNLPTGFAPYLLAEPVQSQIECPPTPVDSVCFFLGNYNQVNAGQLTVRALNENGQGISEADVDSATIRDLACTRFEFPRNICAAGQKRTLEISHRKESPNSSIAVFRTPAGVTASHVLLSRRPSGLRMVYQDPATLGRIWENPDAQPRAYLAPETATAPGWQRAEELFASAAVLRRTAFVESPASPCPSNPGFPAEWETARLTAFDVAANRVSVAVNASTSGTLVLVDAFMPGWTARVDGKPQPVFPVNGAFRGTCIGSPGPHEIVFDYEPGEWKAGVLLSFSGLAGVVAMAFLSMRTVPTRRLREAEDVRARGRVS